MLAKDPLGIFRKVESGVQGCLPVEDFQMETAKPLNQRVDVWAIRVWNQNQLRVRDAYHNRMFRMDRYDKEMGYSDD